MPPIHLKWIHVLGTHVYIHTYKRTHTHTSQKKLANTVSTYIAQRQTGIIEYKYEQINKLAKHLMKTNSQKEVPNSTEELATKQRKTLKLAFNVLRVEKILHL